MQQSKKIKGSSTCFTFALYVDKSMNGHLFCSECEKQTSYVLQLEEILADNTNEHELADLVRHVNMTVWKLQAEFDTAMVARKLGRFSVRTGVSRNNLSPKYQRNVFVLLQE